MHTKIIEVSNASGGGVNWGKFLLGRPDVEWHRRSGLAEVARQVTEQEGWDYEPGPALHTAPLLRQLGWTHKHLWVLDLQTGEGACFLPGGFASADLDKHRIRVCPLFEPFLAWLYQQPLQDLEALPDFVELPDAPSSLYGYRRSGGAEAHL